MIYGLIGGDMRNRYLSSLINEEEKCIVYDDEETKIISKEIEVIKKMDEFISLSNVIIASVPFSRDNINIYAPFINKEIDIEGFVSNIKNKIFIAGNIKEKWRELLLNNDNKVIDLMDYEEYEILNAIATSEGVIKEMIEQTDININGSKVLVLGYGKCGKQISKDLKALNAKITVCARKLLDFSMLKANGFESITYSELQQKENVCKYDFIINTVPAVVLKRNVLRNIKRDAMIIDIASMPGGIDMKDLEACKKKAHHLLGLPGKVSPKSSAKIIFDLAKSLIEQECT